ncbi:MAG: DUF4230 domain-containing protein [Bacteroidaceae bacterium]|nr:DUF4230 domain-containing protein [Bacteroidaceae bacterium]
MFVITLLLVALAIHRLTKAIESEEGPMTLTLESDTGIGPTPAQVTSIRRIGKWEFLSMQMEEIIDTAHSRLLRSDKELVRIYRGTIRLGIDMSQLPTDWLTAQGDTAILRLPPIKQLNRDFIDEARTQTFYETGSWSNHARERMYREAQRRMKARLARSNAYKQAEANGREQMTALMHTFGFRTVEISFGNNSVKR